MTLLIVFYYDYSIMAGKYYVQVDKNKIKTWRIETFLLFYAS